MSIACWNVSAPDRVTANPRGKHQLAEKTHGRKRTLIASRRVQDPARLTANFCAKQETAKTSAHKRLTIAEHSFWQGTQKGEGGRVAGGLCTASLMS